MTFVRSLGKTFIAKTSDLWYIQWVRCGKKTLQLCLQYECLVTMSLCFAQSQQLYELR